MVGSRGSRSERVVLVKSLCVEHWHNLRFRSMIFFIIAHKAGCYLVLKRAEEL